MKWAAIRVIDEREGRKPDREALFRVCEVCGLPETAAEHVNGMAESVLDLVAAMSGKVPVFEASSKDGGGNG